MKGNHQTIADLVPVDLPCNMMISAAWYTAMKKQREPIVYQITTGGLNPFTWGEMGMRTFLTTVYFPAKNKLDAVKGQLSKWPDGLSVAALMVVAR